MKNTPFFSSMYCLLGILLLISACKDDEMVSDDPCHEANVTGEWGYDHFGGPACWSMVCGHDGCLGDHQSPLDIANAVPSTDLPELNLWGSSTTTKIVHNGHTIEFEQEPGTYLDYGLTENGLVDQFTLGQFHFHAKSEHLINGNHAPLEAHMVCRSVWRNEYIVLGVLFEEGASNPFLAQFVDHLPDGAGKSFEDEDLTYSAFDLLPEDTSYFTYMGSLTTPPCSEVVNWIVMENKVQATATEIEAFTKILKDNYRPVQPLNGRIITRVQR